METLVSGKASRAQSVEHLKEELVVAAKKRKKEELERLEKVEASASTRLLVLEQKLSVQLQKKRDGLQNELL